MHFEEDPPRETKKHGKKRHKRLDFVDDNDNEDPIKKKGEKKK